MVYNFQDFRGINVVHGLGLLIMIHQDQLFFLHSQKISSGNRTDIFSVLIYYREGSVAVFTIISLMLSV